jgi:hypothetical protein
MFHMILAILAAASNSSVAPRRLPPGSAVCVNPVLNLARLELDAERTTGELAVSIREAGFRPQRQGAQCDATVFTEIVAVSGRRRKNVDTEFRIVLSGEQIPRLCSSARGRSGQGVIHDAILAAFAEQARQIREAQAKGMAPYPGAVE